MVGFRLCQEWLSLTSAFRGRIRCLKSKSQNFTGVVCAPTGSIWRTFCLNTNEELGTVLMARDIFFTDQTSYIAHIIIKILYVRSAFA